MFGGLFAMVAVPAAELGRYLGPAQVVGLAGGWVVAAIESVVRPSRITPCPQ